MATFDITSTASRDYGSLTKEQRRRFMSVVRMLVDDLNNGPVFRPQLRVRVINRSREDRYLEMTWDENGRAVFEIGDTVLPGHAHVIWRRIGTHDEIFKTRQGQG